MMKNHPRITKLQERENKNIMKIIRLNRLMAGGILIVLSGVLQAGSVTYTYDTLGRLKTATYSNGTVITYNYDAAGNRVSQITTGAP